MKNTKAIGDISEAVFAAKALQAGYSVARPFGDNQPYDLILDKNGTLLKVQVKTGRLSRSAIIFSTSSIGYKGKRKLYDKASVDAFGVYEPRSGRVFLVPFDEVPAKEASLQLVYPGPKNQFTCRYAQNYEL